MFGLHCDVEFATLGRTYEWVVVAVSLGVGQNDEQSPRAAVVQVKEEPTYQTYSYDDFALDEMGGAGDGEEGGAWPQELSHSLSHLPGYEDGEFSNLGGEGSHYQQDGQEYSRQEQVENGHRGKTFGFNFYCCLGYYVLFL
jgi:hypothetical protein